MATDHRGGNTQPTLDLEEHQGILNAKRTYDAPKAVRMDEVTANLTYTGHAVVGTLDSEAKWRIFKIEKNVTITTTTYADGNEDFDNVWDDRASLTYS